MRGASAAVWAFLFVAATDTLVSAHRNRDRPDALGIGQPGQQTDSRPKPGPGGWPAPPRRSQGLSLLQTHKESGQQIISPQESDEHARLPSPSVQFVLTELLRIPGSAYEHIAMDVPYNNLWEELRTFPERRPRVFNVMLATFKTWSADLMVQLGSSQAKFDWRRSLSFATFGFVYVGLLQWFLYVSVFTWACPHAIVFANEPTVEKLNDKDGQMDLLMQVFLDNFVLQTLLYFPVFYVIKELVRQADIYSVPAAVRSALAKYCGNFWNDNLTSLAVWIPMDFFIFAAPMWMRMPLEHSVGWLWTMLLSYMRGATPVPDQQDVK